MKVKLKKVNLKNIPVYEHLEWTLKNTTYADRMKWLEEAFNFAMMLREQKIRPHRPKKQ